MMHVKSAIKYFNKWGWFFDKERKEKNMECMKKHKKQVTTEMLYLLILQNRFV